MTRPQNKNKTSLLLEPAALFAHAQEFTPKQALSKFAGRLAQSQRAYLKTPLIYAFAKAYDIRLDEYQRKHWSDYASFNDFFTRELQANTRPIDPRPDWICCPADGVLSECGDIHEGKLIQAKGRTYSLAQLLADYESAKQCEGGSFATIYLAPSNYHRVHMPFEGVLTHTRYVPGELFSVNHATAAHIPDLFARNERLVCTFDTKFGQAFVVLVGAMIVAGIECVATGRFERTDRLQSQVHHLPLKKGDELGRFYLGSTAIVVLPKPALFKPTKRQSVKMGMPLGQLNI